MTPDPLERLLGGPDPPMTPRPEFEKGLLDRLLTALSDDTPLPLDVRTASSRSPVPPGARVLPEQSVLSRRVPIVWLTAAVLLAALGIGLAAFWPDRDDVRTTIPAVVDKVTSVPAATVTAIPGVSDRTILEIELPVEAVPAGPASVSLSHLTLFPGEEAAHAPRTGIELDYVMSGQLTVQTDGDVRILRANTGAWESAPASTTLSLSAGDAVLFVDLGDVAFANPGSAPSEVLAFGLVSDAAGSSPFEVPGWIVNDYALAGGAFPVPSPGILLPGAPVVLRVNRAVLEPQALMPGVPTDRFQLTVVVPVNGLGTPVVPNVSSSSDGRTRNLGPATIAVYSATLEVPGAEGTPLAASSDAACPFPVGTAFVTGTCEASGPGE